jgi:hypothetical protein
LQYRGLDGKEILKVKLKEYVGMALARLIWLTIRTAGSVLRKRFYKMQVIRITEKLTASE